MNAIRDNLAPLMFGGVERPIRGAKEPLADIGIARRSFRERDLHLAGTSGDPHADRQRP